MDLIMINHVSLLGILRTVKKDNSKTYIAYNLITLACYIRKSHFVQQLLLPRNVLYSIVSSVRFILV